MELVAIGTSQFLLGFALTGVEAVLANRANVLEKVAQHRNAGIIILDEQLLEGLAPLEIESLQTSISPVILTVAQDSTEHNRRLRHTIKTTLGVDLFA
jgi:vacuolar-type H+-ATPase subunit F/Vma7